MSYTGRFVGVWDDTRDVVGHIREYERLAQSARVHIVCSMSFGEMKRVHSAQNSRFTFVFRWWYRRDTSLPYTEQDAW